MKRILFAIGACLLPSLAFAACNPTPMGDFNNASSNFKTALDGSSNCFGFVGLADSTGANAFPSVSALADATANPTDALFGSLNFVYNGTTWDRLRGVNTGTAKTDMSSIAGTATVTGGVAGLQAVGGPVASGGSNADNPLKVGGVFNTTQPTVTNGQIVDSQFTARGAAIVATGADTFTTSSAQSGTWTVQPGNTANSTPWLTTAGQSGTWTVQPGNTANSTPWLTQPVPGTAGGTAVCYLAATASTNSTNCKASAGQVYLYHLENTTSTIYYIRMYNLTTGPTCSSATGYVDSIPIPAGSTGSGVVVPQDLGEAFATGIGFCVTGGASGTDNTNAAVGVFVRILYK